MRYKTHDTEEEAEVLTSSPLYAKITWHDQAIVCKSSLTKKGYPNTKHNQITLILFPDYT